VTRREACRFVAFLASLPAGTTPAAAGEVVLAAQRLMMT
jgi:hypothetical protein